MEGSASATDSRQGWVVGCTLAGFMLFYLMNYHPVFQVIRNTLITPWIANNYLNFLVTYVLIGVPVFLATFAINRQRYVLASLGLAASFPRGFLVGFVAALPTLVGHGIAAGWQVGSSGQVATALIDGIGAGVFEELYFRGFLFGSLFRYTRAGFVPIILFTSVVFALVHLTQAHSGYSELIGILTFTALGSALFAWLYVEWGYNLWVPITLHGLMDLWWNLFDAGQNAAGSLESNVPRLLAVVFAITLTMVYKRRKHIPLAVNRGTWWWRAEEKVSATFSSTGSASLSGFRK
jgi:membrane protease YdiL (CAAX protease family)